MNKLLYIKASPRGSEARSAKVADAYLAALRKRDPALAIDFLDLASERLPDFDGNKVAAKMAVITGEAHDGAQRTAWDEVTAFANRFIAANVILIATPMWNGGIPYKLKQYIDIIHQPGLLFGLDPQKGYFGLLKNKRAVLTLTAGAFGPGMPSPQFGVDHQSTYLRAWLNQAGITEIQEIRLQPTLLTADPEDSLKSAIMAAQALAA